MLEDCHFDQYHLTDQMNMKIIVMKRNKESTGLNHLRLSDSKAASHVSPAHCFVKTVFSC